METIQYLVFLEQVEAALLKLEEGHCLYLFRFLKAGFTYGPNTEEYRATELYICLPVFCLKYQYKTSIVK